MNPDQAKTLRTLVHAQTIAALGTLHRGEPYVSMVPYALSTTSADFFIHVSHLAAHTADMIANARVSLLIISPDAESAQSRARVTVQGDAYQLAGESPEYAVAKVAYIERFPNSAGIFELGDFSIFRITPISARVVGGFAQAFSAGAESYARALREEA